MSTPARRSSARSNSSAALWRFTVANGTALLTGRGARDWTPRPGTYVSDDGCRQAPPRSSETVQTDAECWSDHLLPLVSNQCCQGATAVYRFDETPPRCLASRSHKGYTTERGRRYILALAGRSPDIVHPRTRGRGGSPGGVRSRRAFGWMVCLLAILFALAAAPASATPGFAGTWQATLLADHRPNEVRVVPTYMPFRLLLSSYMPRSTRHFEQCRLVATRERGLGARLRRRAPGRDRQGAPSSPQGGR